MPANIMEVNGKYAFAAVGSRKDVWHALGQYVATAQTKDEMLRLAGLDWPVEKRQLCVEGRDGKPYKVRAWGIFRRNTNGGTFLGAVGEQYTPIQNDKMLGWMDALIENADVAHFDTAGALGKGERIFASIRIPSADVTGAKLADGTPDTQQAYLIGMGSHDGSSRNKFFLAYVRPVCQNTLEAALSDNTQRKLASLSVKHTRNAESRMDAMISAAMTGLQADARNLETKLRALSERKLTRETTASILERLWPVPTDAKTGKPLTEGAAVTRRENVLADVLKLYEVERQRGAGDSAYSLLQAVTEWTDHLRGVRVTERRDGMDVDTLRAENAAVGAGAKLKSDALETILSATGGQPSLLDAVAASYTR